MQVKLHDKGPSPPQRAHFEKSRFRLEGDPDELDPEEFSPFGRLTVALDELSSVVSGRMAGGYDQMLDDDDDDDVTCGLRVVRLLPTVALKVTLPEDVGAVPLVSEPW